MTSTASGAADQYSVVPETVEIAKEDMAKEIAAWIDDEEVAEGYLDDASNDGIVMLINLNKDSADAVADSANLCTSVQSEIAEIETTGLADAQVSTFNDYKRRLNAKRKVLNGTDYAITDPIFAGKLIAAVRKLGPFVATNLDNEIRHQKARGNLTLTRKCIIQVLGEIETDKSNQTSRRCARLPSRRTRVTCGGMMHIQWFGMEEATRRRREYFSWLAFLTFSESRMRSIMSRLASRLVRRVRSLAEHHSSSLTYAPATLKPCTVAPSGWLGELGMSARTPLRSPALEQMTNLGGLEMSLSSSHAMVRLQSKAATAPFPL